MSSNLLAVQSTSQQEIATVPELELFQAALGLAAPWRVVGSDFDLKAGQLDLQIDFARGARFACPACGNPCPGYDTEAKIWRHLNFFQYQTLIHARLPHVECESDGIRQVEVPWARAGSGFTVLFEALVLVLAREMPVHAISRLFGEHDNRIWRVVHFHVERARAREDWSGVQRVGMDETSRRRGHRYVSMFVDLDRVKVLFATPAAMPKAWADLKPILSFTEAEASSCPNSARTWRRPIARAPNATSPGCRSRSIATTWGRT